MDAITEPKMIGRALEKSLLKEYLETRRSEFIAVYGRRRVGKTFFIRQVIGDRACFALTGMENAGLQDQLANFFSPCGSILQPPHIPNHG